MEVIRNYEPKNNFLQKKVRKLATKEYNSNFDECSSGFVKHLGGFIKNIMSIQI